jgi:hypothetical protein
MKTELILTIIVSSFIGSVFICYCVNCYRTNNDTKNKHEFIRKKKVEIRFNQLLMKK